MAKKPSFSVEVAKVMGARLRGIPPIDLSERINQSNSTDLPNLRQLIKETLDYVRRERKKNITRVSSFS